MQLRQRFNCKEGVFRKKLEKRSKICPDLAYNEDFVR